MEMMMVENTIHIDDLLSIFTESFFCEGNLYNASYIPTDDSIATIMLEKVAMAAVDHLNHKDEIMVITIVNSSKISVNAYLDKSERYEIALAAATAAYKFNLVKNYLNVDVMEDSIPIHINLNNR